MFRIILVLFFIALSVQSSIADEVKFTNRTVISVTPIYEYVVDRQVVGAEKGFYCEYDDGREGSFWGAIAGGVVGNQFGRGWGRAGMTILGSAIGMNVGHNIDSGEKCYRVSVPRYREIERRLPAGFDVELDNGEIVRSDVKYSVGERVRVRTTYY